ncbi:hypothetical protein Tco_0286937 [Tanacetum coccineum]
MSVTTFSPFKRLHNNHNPIRITSNKSINNPFLITYLHESIQNQSISSKGTSGGGSKGYRKVGGYGGYGSSKGFCGSGGSGSSGGSGAPTKMSQFMKFEDHSETSSSHGGTRVTPVGAVPLPQPKATRKSLQLDHIDMLKRMDRGQLYWLQFGRYFARGPIVCRICKATQVKKLVVFTGRETIALWEAKRKEHEPDMDTRDSWFCPLLRTFLYA